MFILAKGGCSIPEIEPVIQVASFALKLIQYVAPVLLILWGSIDLVKSIVQGKEEDIKKSQKTLIKRIISAVILFLLPMLVASLLGLIGSTEWKTCWNAYNDGNLDKIKNNSGTPDNPDL